MDRFRIICLMGRQLKLAVGNNIANCTLPLAGVSRKLETCSGLLDLPDMDDPYLLQRIMTF